MLQHFSRVVIYVLTLMSLKELKKPAEFPEKGSSDGNSTINRQCIMVKLASCFTGH